MEKHAETSAKVQDVGGDKHLLRSFFPLCPLVPLGPLLPRSTAVDTPSLPPSLSAVDCSVLL